LGVTKHLAAAMLSFFSSPPFRDPILGEFARSGGHWRGKIELSGAVVPLVLAGNRAEPGLQALRLGRTVVSNFEAWRSVIAQPLFEHYEPYAEALALAIRTPADVWAHVTFAFVSVTPLSHALTIEFGLTTAWDEEHTLGARFQDGRFLELCGSVLSP
jgi:hypothetical protein